MQVKLLMDPRLRIKNMRFLITGGAGFVGSHLCEALLNRGDEVVVLDNLLTGRESNLAKSSTFPNFKFIKGTILDQSILDELISQSDQVLHLAAAVGLFNILRDPFESLKINIRGSEMVLETCNKFSKPVLVTSTSEIYGKNSADSLSEDDDRIIGSPVKIRWSYSDAKAIEEALAFSFWKLHGLETKIVRLFNTVGPRQVGNYGMVVPRFVQSALASEDILVYGDGSQTRCFGHVHDIVKGIISVLNSKKTVGQAINLGVSEEISILNLAHKVKELTNAKSEIRLIPYSEAYDDGFEEMTRRVPNTTKIHKLTGWTPEIGLDRIILDVIDDQKNGDQSLSESR